MAAGLTHHDMTTGTAPLKQRYRLSLDVSDDLNNTLEELVRGTKGTKSDVLRRAIALMKVAADAKAQGNKLGIVDSNNYLVTEIVGL